VRITSEHVARVLDVGTLETGAPYMVMEFLDGSDLEAVVRDEGPLTVEQAIEFILQACEAIAEAHGLGIVHRDIKPSNLFRIRRADGRLSVKVLDFGISKITGPARELHSIATTQSLMGSPLYMSPEQMGGAVLVDGRTDIWALGVTLYQLVTGAFPFSATTLTELSFQVLMQPPQPLRQLRPDVPAGLEAVILRCLEKNRDDRYRNVGELAIALGGIGPARNQALVDRIRGILRGSETPEVGATTGSTKAKQAGAWSGTMTSLGGTLGTQSTQRRARLGKIALVALMVTLIPGALLTWRHVARQGRGVAPPSSQIVASSTESAPPTPVLPASTQAASPVAPAVLPPVPSATALPSVEHDVPSVIKPRPGAKPPVGSGAAPKATATPVRPRSDEASDCDPNYVLDAQGEKHFKPECFMHHP
jgi:serine/threonine-protein kinase